eukprot:CAMPEP_0171458178 /NCGR_PEP_ID=MMETSP0945-20130129/3962_1 /TAXON_ID=109269 /ORGANISM="Vaucheria litorea, Strain CCMP2940" /LENGTH=303 /DNA_ID=CAMNT_0011983937 /DNA_START=267 /DNA_END=1178 /DNA_ORIENTATION=+
MRYFGLIEPQEVPDIAVTYLGYFSVALSFTIAFYLNNTFADFREQGRQAVAASSPANDMVFLIKCHLKEFPKLQKCITRLLNAAHYLSWLDLAKSYSWQELEHRGLLTIQETKVLRSNNAPKHPQIMLWILDTLSTHYRNECSNICQSGGPHTLAQMEHDKFMKLQDYVVEIRRSFGTLGKLRSIPIPHPYTHMLCIFVIIFLMVLGVYAGIGESESDSTSFDEAWWIFGYVIVCIAFLSLYNIAVAQQEPFGLDISDINPLAGVEDQLEYNEFILSAPLLDWEKSIENNQGLYPHSNYDEMA